MAADKPVKIISDSPEKDSDLFGFDAYSKTIAELITFRENPTPLVIGVYGPWGSGKTTLMRTVQSRIGAIAKTKPFDAKVFRKTKTVWFDAWKYSRSDEILAAFIEEIFKAMKADGWLSTAKGEIEKLIQRLNPFKIVGKLSEAAIGVNISDYFAELDHKGKLSFYDTFQDFFHRLLWTWLNLRPQLTSDEQPDDTQGALAVFIDDLDRCPQERIVTVLETIKLFLDKKGCVFVIGAANEIIEKALRSRYDEDAAKFMDKIVQVTFNLPHFSEDDFKAFIAHLDEALRSAIAPHLPQIIQAVGHNPRQVKRFLNNLNLQLGLVRNSGLDLQLNHALYWSLIDYLHPGLARDIKERPETLFDIQKHTGTVKTQFTAGGPWEVKDETLADIPHSFHPYLKIRELVEILQNFKIEPQELKNLITFGAVVESAEVSKEKQAKEKAPLDDLDAMVEVGAGEFIYQDGKATIETPFSIDVYPVTNRQFEHFIKARGYENKNYWSDDGWRWREAESITQPKYWDDEKWNPPEHPVVGVSFYEAEAYAKWAKKQLPTEKQWERAARGTDGRKYPWGNAFDKERCNTRESKIGKTTRVTRYPNGVSPAGCYDMAGNVWEWCQDWYDQDKTYKVLRGGSWDGGRGGARCAFRSGYFPDYRLHSIGFRCVRIKN